jgi:hypothetical protein
VFGGWEIVGRKVNKNQQKPVVKGVCNKNKKNYLERLTGTRFVIIPPNF